MDPAADGFVVNQHRRMEHFNIKVIRIPSSGELNSDSIIPRTNLDDFHQAVKDDGDRSGTLIVAKDLSRAMIDALGTRHHLAPEFFASHLEGTELFRMGYKELPGTRAPARAPNLLPDYVRKAPFYTVGFRRPYHVKGGADTVFKERGKVTNLPRGAQILKESMPNVFVSEKISVYKLEGANVGIVLTDELLSLEAPASYILSPVTLLPDGQPTPSIDGLHQQDSSRQALISHLQSLPPATTRDLFDGSVPLLLPPVLKLVERSSAQFLTHARSIMTRILTRHCDGAFPDSIPFFLYISRSLHRHIYDQQKLLRHALRLMLLLGVDDGVMVAQKQDLGFLAEDMAFTLMALEEDVVASAQIREGRMVRWVGKFATLFLPVSLLATILAISDPGYLRWAILGGLSVPFVVISGYFLFYWKPRGIDSSRLWFG